MIVGGKSVDELPTAYRQLFLVERIKTLATFLPHGHKVRLLQLFQMVAHRRLVHFAVELIDHVIHTQPHAAEMFHNLLAGFVGKRFCENHWINVHRRYYIDAYQYVKGLRKMTRVNAT